MKQFISNISTVIKEVYKTGDLGLIVVMLLVLTILTILVGWMTLMELTGWNSNACLSCSIFTTLGLVTFGIIALVCSEEEE